MNGCSPPATSSETLKIFMGDLQTTHGTWHSGSTFGRGRKREALLLQAIKLEPRKAEHTTDLGFLYLKIGLGMRAKKQFKKALGLDPQDARAKAGLEEAR